MGAGAHISDVLRTIAVWGTIAFLGYLSFLLIQDRVKNPTPQAVTIEDDDLIDIRAAIAAIDERHRNVNKRLDDLTQRLLARSSIEAESKGQSSSLPHYFQLTPAFLSPVAGTWLQAFIETGSKDRRVLLTLNEAACHITKTDYRIRQMSAAYRHMQGRDGVLVTVMFYHPVPSDMDVWLTVMQAGVSRYGPKEKWSG